MKEILTEVSGDIAVFADGAEQSDDITMLGVMFCGKGQEEDLSSTNLEQRCYNA